MHLTNGNNNDVDALTKDFLNEKVKNVFDAISKQNKCFFLTKPDPKKNSYYVPRKKKVVKVIDYNLESLNSIEAFEKELIEMWTNQGHIELTQLAAKIV